MSHTQVDVKWESQLYAHVGVQLGVPFLALAQVTDPPPLLIELDF
jgi:hypothetical protein